MRNIESLHKPDLTAIGKSGRAAAAKIHVLALHPLKERLGPKWPRVSELVHKLFEAAIIRAQGPSDFFRPLDELSYAVVFRSISVEEANLVCRLISKEVCQALFGDQIDEVSVRNVVASVQLPAQIDPSSYGKLVEAILESTGTETVFTLNRDGHLNLPVTSVAANQLKPTPPACDRISEAHIRFGALGVSAGFFPIWELQRSASSTLFFLPFHRRAGQVSTVSVHSLFESDSNRIAEMELLALRAAGAYAARVSDAKRICAVGVEVSYDTLSRLHSRISYITALQKLNLPRSTPLVLKISDIPEGTPAARIGELAAMLNLPNIRLLLDFQSLRTLPKFEFRLNAHGLGGTLPKTMDEELQLKSLRNLVDLAGFHKAFVFLDHVDTPAMLHLARRSSVRFGIGTALSMQHYSGLEEIPSFPILQESTVLV